MSVAEGHLALSPEYEVLVRAAGPSPGERPRRDTADWAEIWRLAEWHRLAPLVFRDLRLHPAPDAPEDVVEKLRESYITTAGANLYLRRELDRVLATLSEEGVAVMVLKGMALVEQVYHELGLRPMVDLDLLVPEAAFERAGVVLEALGYSGHHGFRATGDGPSRGAFVNAEQATTIDLHRHIADDVEHLDHNGMWARARPAGEAGYLVPAPEDLLLHLGIHFVIHRETSSRGALGQLADMAWVIDAGVDWDRLAATADSSATSGRLYLALTALVDVLGSPVPAETFAALRRPRATNGEMTDRFIQHRVLDVQTWHHPGYFHRRARTAFTSTGRPLGRLIPSRAHLERRYGERGEPHQAYARLYGRRVRRAVTPLFRRHVWTDQRLHRWVNTLDHPESR
ncbi:MAG: nucleotidyltransferase domain-containing protein [Acidimicrobiales bacterium]